MKLAMLETGPYNGHVHLARATRGRCRSAMLRSLSISAARGDSRKGPLAIRVAGDGNGQEVSRRGLKANSPVAGLAIPESSLHLDPQRALCAHLVVRSFDLLATYRRFQCAGGLPGGEWRIRLLPKLHGFGLGEMAPCWEAVFRSSHGLDAI